MRRLRLQLGSTSRGTQPPFARLPAFSESRIVPLTGFDSGKSPSLPTALPAIAALRRWLIGAGKMAETEFPTYLSANRS